MLVPLPWEWNPKRREISPFLDDNSIAMGMQSKEEGEGT